MRSTDHERLLPHVMLLEYFPIADFHIATSQVKRFNNEATRLCTVSEPQTRMQAVQGDLDNPAGPSQSAAMI